MAIIAITTRSSISVNARREFLLVSTAFVSPNLINGVPAQVAEAACMGSGQSRSISEIVNPLTSELPLLFYSLGNIFSFGTSHKRTSV
jgi:hypothetical protein